MVQSSVRAGEASTVSPSIAPFGRATELPAQRRRRRACSRKGQAHAAQAGVKLGQVVGRVHTAQLGRGGFGPLASDLLCYFLYILKSMQI
jgi:hypothetical protein